MLAEKTVQEFLTAPVLLLRRLFGEGASGTAGAARPSAEGRPRPPSTRCAPSGAHAPEKKFSYPEGGCAALKTAMKIRLRHGWLRPAIRSKQSVFNAAAVSFSRRRP